MEQGFTAWYRTRFSVRLSVPRPAGEGRSRLIHAIVWSVRDWLEDTYGKDASPYSVEYLNAMFWPKRYWNSWEMGGDLPKMTFVSTLRHARSDVQGTACSIRGADGEIETWACRVQERVTVMDPDESLRRFPRMWRTDIALSEPDDGAARHARSLVVDIAVSYRDERSGFGVAQVVPDPRPPRLLRFLIDNERLICECSSVPLTMMDLTVTAQPAAPDADGRDGVAQDGTRSRISAHDLWDIVSDPKRDVPLAVVGLDAGTRRPLIDVDALHDMLFPDMMVCVPRDMRAIGEIRRVFDARMPGSSPRADAVRVYAAHPAFPACDDDPDEDPKLARLITAELGRHPSVTRVQIDAYRSLTRSVADTADTDITDTTDTRTDGTTWRDAIWPPTDGTRTRDAATLLLRDLLEERMPDMTVDVDSILRVRNRHEETAKSVRLERQLKEATNRIERLGRQTERERAAYDDRIRDLEKDNDRLSRRQNLMDEERDLLERSMMRLRADKIALKGRANKAERELRAMTAQHSQVEVAANGNGATGGTGVTGMRTMADQNEDAQIIALLNDDNRRLEHEAREYERRMGELTRKNEQLRQRIMARVAGSGVAAELEAARGLLSAKLPAKLVSNSRVSNSRYDQDIVRFYETLYPDRISVHDNAWRTLRECVTKPSLVWQAMQLMCTAVYDIYATGQGSGNPGDRFRTYPDVGGFELAENEGQQTHRDAKFMRLRQIEDHGRTLLMEPHLRIGNREDDASLRVYFAWNPDTGRIVIGAIGRHLENYTTRTRKR
ncbi:MULTISPECIES: hypothetical protein [unclassified Bifidobacterium]|uniref:hypothetical protein n=1 Tax=unclassified Bifidobacterium TaxID=2608897 RepID=UPI00112E98BE|nr:MULTISPECIES: hypothetical protein [unclassified Bifidobacterium]